MRGSSKRSFLFLQGPASPFFARLADRLGADGHRIVKLNFHAGDWAYWAPRRALAFRGRLEVLPGFLDEVYRRFDISDQVLYGDRRPVHKAAVERAAACGVRTHVFEEGYFRPHWVTLEREGVNARSLLPRDPHWYRQTAARLGTPPETVTFHSPFFIMATHDVLYHTAGLVNPLFFPHYVGHGLLPVVVEYAGYCLRLPRVRLWDKRRDAQRIARLIDSGRPYFVLPLQLNSDAQIREHSSFRDMAEVLTHVVESFAAHAPKDALLVIKNHPLDPGLNRYGAQVKRLARRYGCAGRLLYLESGFLEPLLKYARGCVTVNSTSGIQALGLGCPVKTLSRPIYDLPGLTFQGTLADFWTAGERPDAELFTCFRRVVTYATQINGGFYCEKGIALAVPNSARVLTAERSPLEALQ